MITVLERSPSSLQFPLVSIKNLRAHVLVSVIVNNALYTVWPYDCRGITQFKKHNSRMTSRKSSQRTSFSSLSMADFMKMKQYIFINNPRLINVCLTCCLITRICSFKSIVLRGESPYKLDTENNVFPYPQDLPLGKAAPSDLSWFVSLTQDTL